MSVETCTGRKVDIQLGLIHVVFVCSYLEPLHWFLFFRKNYIYIYIYIYIYYIYIYIYILANIAHEFVFTSSAVHDMTCSSYLGIFWDRRQVAVGLLFIRVLLQGFVQNRISILVLFPSSFLSKSFIIALVVEIYQSTDSVNAW